MNNYIKHDINYDENKPDIVYHNVINGRNVFIIYLGSHPCAYIESIYDYYNDDNQPDVHGGLSFYNTLTHWNDVFPCFKQEFEKEYIGWDYGHYEDYIALKHCQFIDGKKYTTDEIIEEIINAIKWLDKQENKNSLNAPKNIKK